jgi:Gamma-glutamyl cyclotransferase, AIG2-like
MRRIDVFFYGLFMDEELLRDKGVQPSSLRAASLKGFQLRIGQRATLVPSETECVYGIVASLSHREVDQLYSDPSLRGYRPEAVSATLPDGETVPALCFNLIVPPAAEEHNPEYASRLRALAERLPLPAEYIKTIQ